MQRVEPRPEPAQSQSQSQEGGGGSKGLWNIPTGFASTGANPHTQSFEEIYGVPENFLEIEVRPPPRTPYARRKKEGGQGKRRGVREERKGIGDDDVDGADGKVA